MDQRIGRWLNENVGPVRNSCEANLPERDVNIHAFVLPCVSDLLGERLEFPVEGRSTPPFFLLCFELLFVPKAMLASAIASLVKLHFRGFPIELNVSRLPLANHDGCLQVDVNQDNHFMSAGLEEQMLHVAEKHIDVFVTEWRYVTETVLMYFNFSRNALAIQRRSKVDIRELQRPAVWW